MDCELVFDDKTILETEGEYSKVCEIMKGESQITGEWYLKSNLMINTYFGISQLVIDFYYDGKLVIVYYVSTIKDAFYNPDLQCLAAWSEEAGWGTPQITQSLAEDKISFWEHFRLTGLIASDFLEKVHGPAPEFQINTGEEQ
jgi:hypothetical protein